MNSAPFSRSGLRAAVTVACLLLLPALAARADCINQQWNASISWTKNPFGVQGSSGGSFESFQYWLSGTGFTAPSPDGEQTGGCESGPSGWTCSGELNLSGWNASSNTSDPLFDFSLGDYSGSIAHLFESVGSYQFDSWSTSGNDEDGPGLTTPTTVRLDTTPSTVPEPATLSLVLAGLLLLGFALISRWMRPWRRATIIPPPPPHDSTDLSYK
ncbi:MAG: PEP-CTERM sorting domain-containing protein [Terriglobales bacterium]